MSPSAVVPVSQGYLIPAVEAIIASGDTDSSVISTRGLALATVILPSIMTGTALAILAGDSALGFQANGEVLFATNPANNDTLTLNGVVITFVSGTAGDGEVHIGADAATTMASLQAFLNATTDADLLAQTYTSAGALMTVTAIIHGDDGNAYVFDKSSTHITLSPSGGTLAGGGFRPVYDSSNTAISFTVGAGRAYTFSASLTDGFSYLKLQSGTTEANQRTLTCSLKGV